MTSVHTPCACFACFRLPAQWRERYFILSGSYLFRFESEHGDAPKGVPIPVEACTFNAEDVDEGGDRQHLIHISSLRKNYVLKADTREVRDEWVAVLKQSKLRATKERLGHLKPNVSRPALLLVPCRAAMLC